MNHIERITPSEVKRKLASVLATVEYGGHPVIVERHGKAVAAVIPMELYALVRDLVQGLEDEADWKEIQAALADPENAVPLDWDAGRYGKTDERVSTADSTPRRQKPPARAATAAEPRTRPHRRARR